MSRLKNMIDKYCDYIYVEIRMCSRFLIGFSILSKINIEYSDDVRNRKNKELKT